LIQFAPPFFCAVFVWCIYQNIRVQRGTPPFLHEVFYKTPKTSWRPRIPRPGDRECKLLWVDAELDASCHATSFSIMPLFHDLPIALNNSQKITAFSILILNQKEASILVPPAGRDPQRTEWVKTLSGLRLLYFCWNIESCQKWWNRISPALRSGMYHDSCAYSQFRHLGVTR
jgi:hypothetical protein